MQEGLALLQRSSRQRPEELITVAALKSDANRKKKTKQKRHASAKQRESSTDPSLLRRTSELRAAKRPAVSGWTPQKSKRSCRAGWELWRLVSAGTVWQRYPDFTPPGFFQIIDSPHLKESSSFQRTCGGIRVFWRLSVTL